MNNKRILLIEDSPTQAQYASMLLSEAGYQVTLAENGNSGVMLAEETPPDLVLLDVVLPDMDGFDVCRRLRQRTNTYFPILMFTEQRTAVEDKVDALTTGADDYLAKPFDDREILARVAALLRVKQLIDDLHARLASEQQSYQTLKHIALIDHLTGLYNRHYLREAFEREFELARRYAMPLSCIMGDIDTFRDFNNTYGHLVGDWVLREISKSILSQVRTGDIVGRFGGEEFLILMPMTKIDEATILAERLRQEISDHAYDHPTAGPLHITISLGVSACPAADVEEPDQLINKADQALYKAKACGRNKVETLE